MKQRSSTTRQNKVGRKFSLSDYFDGDMCRCCAIKSILEVHSSLSNAQLLGHFHPQEQKDVRATLDELIKDGEVEFDGSVYRLIATTATTQPEPMKK